MDYRLPGGVRSRTASYNSNYSAESDRLFSVSRRDKAILRRELIYLFTLTAE